MSFTSSPDGRLQYCLGYYEEDQPPLPRILEGLPNVTTRRTVNLNKINFDSRVAPDEIKPGSKLIPCDDFVYYDPVCSSYGTLGFLAIKDDGNSNCDHIAVTAGQ